MRWRVTVPILPIVAAAALGPVAHATPPSGVTAVTLTQGDVPAALAPLAGGSSYTVRELTVAPGGSSGWHYHEGRTIGLVRSGVLTHVHGADCATDTYRAGSIVELPSGTGYVHIDRNLGRDPLVLDVVYLSPAGKPASTDAPAPACAG